MAINRTLYQDNKNVLVIMLTPIDGLNSSVLRSLALVKGLVQNGYVVELLTIKKNDETVLFDINKYEFLKHIKISYANSNSIYNSLISARGKTQTKVKNILRNLYHAFSPFDYTMSIARRIDIKIIKNTNIKYLISISDPKSAHVASNRLLKQGLICEKWIQYWGDPLATDITKTSIYPRFVYNIIEKQLFSKSDAIFYTSPFTLKEQKRLFTTYANRMHYIPTAYIEEKIYPKHKGPFTIGYYGAYYTSVRDIMPLYNACLEDCSTKLIVIGDSDLELRNTPNISIYPRGDISQYEINTDLYVCILNSKGNQIPGKLYHYAGTNKPVLVLLDGDNRTEIQLFFSRFDRYIFCDNNKVDILKAITNIKKLNKEYTPCKSMSCEYIAKEMLEEK